MTERRKAARPGPRGPKPKPQTEPEAEGGERIAKYLARCGVASRRACETLIEDGKVTVDGERVRTPAFKVTGRESIRVGRKFIKPPEPARLWRYHKPAGLITTNSDPEGRPTIYEQLPRSLPRTVTIGRLDLNTEGLLLLTNDGELARALELPGNGFVRRYRARAHGQASQALLDTLAQGATVSGVDYAPIRAEIERTTGANNWIRVELTEGKKREVRRALESLDLKVNRLIRTDYGPFALGDLKPGAVEEVAPETVLAILGELIPSARRPRPKAARTARAASAVGRRRGSANVPRKGGRKSRPPREDKP